MLQATKVISTAIKEGKRLIKILRFGRDDVQDIRESMPFGFDGNPTKDLVALYGSTTEKGKPVIIGYINKNQIADIGESRMYSTNADGAEQFYLHLKNDGTAEFGGNADFLARFNELKSGFDELKSDFNSHIVDWNAFATAYAPGSPTTLGTPATATTSSSSSASIDSAKIEEIKTL